MTTKKKTVKELNDIIDVLMDRVKKLEDHKCKCNHESGTEELKMLDKRIVDINGKVGLLANKLEKNRFNDKQKIKLSNFKCKKCGVNLDSKKKLREHFMNNHPVEIKCKECGASFEEHWKYERHLKEHGMKK